jgi:hypothetical protein
MRRREFITFGHTASNRINHLSKHNRNCAGRLILLTRADEVIE